jgi:hypothetical protein
MAYLGPSSFRDVNFVIYMYIMDGFLLARRTKTCKETVVGR